MHYNTKLRTILIDWYLIHRRDLPWRQTNDPYCIWISEIILQQTRVNQGLAYYVKFVSRFPNVNELANANLDEVLKYWQGLGYYSRARNLLIAAKQIVKQFNGKFPDTYDSLLSIKGIGKYTAAAISSIAYGIPIAVVDGNVFRVVSRYKGIDTPIDSKNAYAIYYNIAEKMMDKTDPSLFNQAMMELGALICTAKNPACSECPLKQNCVAKKSNIIGLLPIKLKKVKTKNRYFYYIVWVQNEKIVLRKRTESDIWQWMYDFPLIETNRLYSVEEILNADEFHNLINSNKPIITCYSEPIKHQLTHQTIYATFIRINGKVPIKKLPSNYLLIAFKELENLAVPRIIEKYLESEFDIKK